MSKQKIILDTQEAVRHFELRTSRMTNLDYDIDEVISSILGALSVFDEIDEAYSNLLDNFSQHGQPAGEDAKILADAMTGLYVHIRRQLDLVECRDNYGIMPLAGHEWSGRDLVVVLEVPD